MQDYLCRNLFSGSSNFPKNHNRLNTYINRKENHWSDELKTENKLHTLNHLLFCFYCKNTAITVLREFQRFTAFEGGVDRRCEAPNSCTVCQHSLFSSVYAQTCVSAPLSVYLPSHTSNSTTCGCVSPDCLTECQWERTVIHKVCALGY